MQNKDLQNSILQWLDKSGYPLELHVHRVALQRGYLCEKSQIYSDVETGVAREIDLVAYKHTPTNRDYTFELNLVIECKKSDKPVVVLCGGKPAERYEHLLGHELATSLNINAGSAYYNLYDMKKERRFESVGEFAEETLAGYSLVPAFGKSDENLYRGVMGLAKADEHFRKEYHEIVSLEKNSEEPVGEDWFRLQMPVMVIDAPLFTLHLNESGDLTLTETDWASILIRLPWAMNRPDAERLCNVQIVRKDHFGGFLASVEKFHEFISRKEIAYLPANA